MARIRTIKPEFWQDEKLSPCDPLTRLVFLGLVSLADDAGRLVDNLRLIDAQIFPNTSDTAHEALMRLSGMGRIRRGVTASGQRIIEIANWSRHQKIQHPNLKGSLPEIVEEQQVTQIHEPLMNASRAAHEPLTHHTNDQRPVPTTSTNDQLEPRQRGPLKGGKKKPEYANFPMALSDAGYNTWLAKLGATDYGTFRKVFAPIFNIPEADRPAELPRDSEFTRIIELYAIAIRGTRSAQFAKPEACAGKAAQLATAARADDSERRIFLARTAMGTVEEQRRLEMAA